MPLPAVGQTLGRRSRRMFEGVHGMRVHLTRLGVAFGVRISYLLCFDGFLMFLVFIYVFWAANKTQERACAESNLYPFCSGVAEILIHELMLEHWPGSLSSKSTGRQVAMTIKYEIDNNA